MRVIESLIFFMLILAPSSGRTFKTGNSDTRKSLLGVFLDKQHQNAQVSTYQQTSPKRKKESLLDRPVTNELEVEKEINYKVHGEKAENLLEKALSFRKKYDTDLKDTDTGQLIQDKAPGTFGTPQQNFKESGVRKTSGEWSYGRPIEANSKENDRLASSQQRTINYPSDEKPNSRATSLKNLKDKQFSILDNLDDIMMKELEKVDTIEARLCAEPKLEFCKDAVTYPIAKAQMSVHSLYDGLAESASDFLTIHTKGQSRMCKKELTSILCKDRFPRCHGAKVVWGNLREECGKAIEACPLQVQESLRNMNLCRKLGEGVTPIDKCVLPIQSHNENYCGLTKDSHVAPWNRHASVEVENLIEIQKALFAFDGHCLDKLYNYLCLPTKMCHNEFPNLEAEFKNQCKSTLKACENSTFSKGMEMFFRCK